MTIENAGYTIIQIVHVSDVTYALGYNPKNKCCPYVTWKMYGREGNYSFNFGNYGSNKKEMELDLLKRCIRYMLCNDFLEIEMSNITLEQFIFE